MLTNPLPWHVRNTIIGVELLKKNGVLGIDYPMQKGKSYQILSIYEKIGGNLLIICPRGLIDSGNWEKQIREHYSKGVTIFDINLQKFNTKKFWDSVPKEAIFICGIESFQSDKILKFPFNINIVAIDESDLIQKVWGTKRSMNMQRIISSIPYRIQATGTKQKKDCTNLWGQWEVIKKGFFGLKSFSAFRDRYCIITMKYNSYNSQYPVVTGYKNQEELSYLIKSNTISLLPEELDSNIVFTKDILVDLSEIEREYYFSFKKYGVSPDGDTCIGGGARFIKARMVSGGASSKYKWIKELPSKIVKLLDLLNTIGKQVVIYAEFVHEVDKISNLLNCPSISGYTEEKNEAIESFRSGKSKYIVGNRAISRGFPLQNCDTMIFYSIPSDPGIYKQVLKRIAGNGSKKELYYYYLLAKDTVDTKILSRFREAVLRGEKFDEIKNINNMSLEDIENNL